jgi:hypothetical protein
MIKTAIVTLIILATSQIALAKLTIANTQPLAVPMENEQGTEHVTQKDVEKIIPTDMSQTDNMNAVAAKIADRSVQAWFNSAQVQGSVLGQTATSVQKKMATDITVKSDEPHGVDHKFSMQILALQAMAKLQYTGWLNAVFNYDAKAAETMVEFSDKIFNKDLFINHTSSSSKGDVSTVGIKWGW